MRKPNLMNFALALILSASFASAADEKAAPLKMGDPAPALQADKWVKGGPITKLEKGNVYVMEFWATWCGPCKAAIPHVTELQKKYKDKGLTVIGMNVWEHDLEEVTPFVEEMGDTMDYAVATDVLPFEGAEPSNKGAMAETWMKAAGRNGIPCSFIVNRDGVIAWIGHPMMMDDPLEAVVNGTFDVVKEAAKMEKIAKLEEQYKEALKEKDFDQVIETLNEMAVVSEKPNSMQADILRVLLMKKDMDKVNELLAKIEGDSTTEPKDLVQVGNILVFSGNGTPLAERGVEMLKKLAEQDGDHKKNALMALYRIHMMKRNYDLALATLDSIGVASKDAASVRPEKISILFQKKDTGAANKLLSEMEQEAGSDPDKLLIVSRVLLRNAKADEGNTDRAASIVEKAIAAGGKRKPAAQRFLASIYASKKDYAKAVEIQKQLVAEATKPAVKKMEERTLKRYEDAAAAAADSAAEKPATEEKSSAESTPETK
jgi:thiol-disulfide isomerase/thioredoxin